MKSIAGTIYWLRLLTIAEVERYQQKSKQIVFAERSAHTENVDLRSCLNIEFSKYR